jgi:hypothetical protein
LTSGTQFDQQTANGNASQQFNLNGLVVPPISSLALASFSLTGGTNLMIAGTNAGIGTYYVLATTNLVQTGGGWTPIATNQVSGSGSFTLTASNGVNMAQAPRQFFILSTTNN